MPKGTENPFAGDHRLPEGIRELQVMQFPSRNWRVIHLPSRPDFRQETRTGGHRMAGKHLSGEKR